MKYLVTATSEDTAELLVKDIEEAGGLIKKRYKVMPEFIVFEDKKKDSKFWTLEFASPYLKRISPDQMVFAGGSDFDPMPIPIERPIGVATATAGWHLDAINLLPIADVPQRPVNMYIIDTGVQSHNDLPPVTYLGGDHTDVNGHGTHVAGLTCSKRFGVNKPADDLIRLYSAQGLPTENGGGLMSDVADAMLACLEHYKNSSRIGIVNMSLSAKGSIQSFSTYDIALRMQEAGMMLVVAAGNRGDSLNDFDRRPELGGIDTFPAEVPGTLCVSALTVTDYKGDNYLAPFSNFGGNARINAPGVEVTSTYKNNEYAAMSGTSMASPIVAGGLALFATALDKRPETAEEAQHIINIFLSAFTSKSTVNKYSDRRKHTDKMLDMSFIRAPETWNAPEDTPKEKPKPKPKPEPKTPETKKTNKKIYWIAAAAFVIGVLLIALV